MTKRIAHYAFMVTTVSVCLSIAPRLWGQEQPNPQVSAHEKVEDGLDVVGFDTLNGRVEVALPNDFSDGDVISGTVITKANGESKEEIAQNQDELSGFVVEVEKCHDIKEPVPVGKSAPKKLVAEKPKDDNSTKYRGAPNNSCSPPLAPALQSSDDMDDCDDVDPISGNQATSGEVLPPPVISKEFS